MTLQREGSADRGPAGDEFARGWLHTEVGRQVRPVVRVPLGIGRRIRRWLRRDRTAARRTR